MMEKFVLDIRKVVVYSISKVVEAESIEEAEALGEDMEIPSGDWELKSSEEDIVEIKRVKR
jgi:hypothetical protein